MIVDTYRVDVFLAGDIAVARQWLREHVLAEPLCVTLTPTEFIYTGGLEHGFVVGLLNYPRFPSSEMALYDRARCIALGLRDACAQRSALIVAPDGTEWLPRKEAA